MDPHAPLDPFGAPGEAKAIRAGVTRNVLAAGSSGLLIQALQIVTFLILVRLLAPEDYGVLAMVTAGIGLAELFRDMGLSAATVRLPSITRAQVNALFWINAALGALMAGAVIAVAPWLAALMREPRVEDVAGVMAVNFLIGGVSAQYLALMRRSLRFVELSTMRVWASGLGSLLALAMAWAGAGYWALVAAAVLNKLLMMLLAMARSGWHPQRPRYEPSVAPMLTFGGHLIGFGLLSYCATNLQTILLARYWGGAEVGYFNRANSLIGISVGQLMRPVRRVAPPTMARLHVEPEAMADFYRSIVALLMLALVPAALWMAYLAEDIVRVVLGGQWDAAVPVLQALALGLPASSLAASSGWLFLARGDSRAMLRWGLVGWPVVIVFKVAGLGWGAAGVALMGSLASYVILWPCMRRAMAGTPLRPVELLVAMRKPLLGGVCALLLMVLLDRAYIDPWPPLPRVALLSLVFAAVYAGLLLTVLGERQRLLGLLRRFRRAAARTPRQT